MTEVLKRLALLMCMALMTGCPSAYRFDWNFEPSAAATCGVPLSEKLERWVARERADTAWLNDLPECPCEIDRHQCSATEVSMNGAIWACDSAGRATRFYHPGAVFELRQRSDGAGQQCTYDAHGQLWTSGPAAGTADRVNPASLIGHRDADVNPFCAALKADDYRYGAALRAYASVRPSSSGRAPDGSVCRANPSPPTTLFSRAVWPCLTCCEERGES